MNSEHTLIESSLERIPPQSVEAEQAVLGGLLVAGSGGNAAIDNTISYSNFGLITSSSKSRILQFSGKVTF